MTTAATTPLPAAMTSKGVKRLFAVLGEKNLRFVGGCVRNALMELPVGDIDFATTLPPDEVQKKLTNAEIKTVPTGIDHGTVTAVINGIGYEITTLRRDVETDGRHAKVKFTDDWAEDAARRDFTVNAVYTDQQGHIYDPLGTGLTDIAKRKIRFIGNPEERITEDALRILRFFRFHTIYGRGQPDAKGLAACTALAPTMKKLSRERITKEFFLLLAHPSAPKTLQVMADSAILPDILPKNINTKRIEQFMKFQSKGNSLEKDLILASRLFLFRNAASIKKDSQFMPLILNKKIQAYLETMAWLNYKTPRIDLQKIRELLYRHGPFLTRAILDITATLQDSPPRDHQRWLKLLNDTTVPVFPVTGKDLLKAGIPSGPMMGDTLKKLEQAWIKSGFSLTKTEILAKH